LRSQRFFLGYLRLQCGNALLQGTLLSGLGLLSLSFSLHPCIFNGLKFGRLFGSQTGNAVFFLLDARGPDRRDLADPGAPGQVLQLSLDGRFARDRLNPAVHTGREEAFTAGFDTCHSARMTLRALRTPSFGLSQKRLALGKCPLDLEVLASGLRVTEVKPLGPYPLQLKRGAQAFGFGGRQLRLHARPHGPGQRIAANHLEACFAPSWARVDHLVIDAPELALPTHCDRLLILRRDDNRRVKKRGLHHTLHIGLTGNADAKVTARFAIVYPSRHRHGLGLSGLQHILARPRPRRSTQPEQNSPPNTSFHRAPIHRKSHSTNRIGSKASNLIG